MLTIGNIRRSCCCMILSVQTSHFSRIFVNLTKIRAISRSSHDFFNSHEKSWYFISSATICFTSSIRIHTVVHNKRTAYLCLVSSREIMTKHKCKHGTEKYVFVTLLGSHAINCIDRLCACICNLSQKTWRVFRNEFFSFFKVVFKPKWPPTNGLNQ